MSTVDFGGFLLSRVTGDDMAGLRALQVLLESDAATWAALEGAPPRSDEAALLVGDRPLGVTPDRKFVWILGTEALIDIVEGFPDPTTWYLGLIFIAPHARNTGLGTKLLHALAEYVRAHGGTAMRLAVVTTNTGARRLYDRMGFAHVARRQRALWHGDTQECDVLELRL